MGKVKGVVVRVVLIIIFGLPKMGLLIADGPLYAGRVEVVDIGIPRTLTEGDGRATRWMRRDLAATLLRPRPTNGHKGTFGRVVVVAGSPGYAGAAVLALRGALRSGAGLVTWAGPRAILALIQGGVSEATALALPGDEDALSVESVRFLLERLDSKDVLAVGPGLGQGSRTQAAIATLVHEWPGAIVLDADALNVMAAAGDDVASTLPEGRMRVLTPHPKEAARLLRTRVSAVLDDRVAALGSLVQRWKSIVLLKGHPTITGDPAGGFFVNSSGDDSLATGGTGDVLTGVIAGLIASGHPPFEAAALGAFVHGRAGELAGELLGSRAVAASDVVERLPAAFLEIERGRNDRAEER